MYIDDVITAAEFLYGHSPAGNITAEKNTILIYGKNDDPLADAFFDLLFSTAYRQDVQIRLIRLCPEGAEQKELDFVCRNEKGIGAFARTEYTENDAVRPLTVQFYDYNDARWREHMENAAYAVDLTGEGNELRCPVCHGSGEIRRLSPAAEEWTAADEERCEVLRVARKVHTAYTSAWNSRYRESDISNELYGKDAAGANRHYCLRSSLRFAVSIPWKLAMAGTEGEKDAAEALYKKLNEPGGGIKDRLAWQEHRSWSAFMVLEGWTAPDVERMRAYCFSGGNDHRDKKSRLHPCLWDLYDDDWNRPHNKSLEKTPLHQWSAAFARLDDYCLLDQVSLIIHHICKETVVSDEYRNKMAMLFRSLEAAILQTGTWGSKEHIGRLRLMENMFSRLRSNETNSYSPWQDACGRFAEGISAEDETVFGRVKEIFSDIRREAKAAVERNRYCDYKKIDADIIVWLPWIISDDKIGTVWKLYSRDNIADNILSSVILRPKSLRLVCDRGLSSSVPVREFADILSMYGIEDIDVSVTDISALEDGTIPAGKDSAVDVTSCGEMRNCVRIPEGAKVIYYGNGGLRDSSGSGFFAPLFHPFDFTMTVNEMLRLRGSEILSGTESNEMLGMEQDYETLWNVSREIKHMPGASGAWRNTIRALQEAESALCRAVYRDESSPEGQFSFAFSPEQLETMTRTGALGVLHELEKMGYISDLFVDPGENRLTCRVFPGPGGANAENALREMLGDSRAESSYAVVNEYLPHGAPAHFIDLEQPVRLDDALPGGSRTSEAEQRQIRLGIRKLVDAGLLIPAGDSGEYRYKSLAVRRELEKEGFALEAYVYYSLFLSGKFDDIRSNVRVKTGESASSRALEKELDILVTRKGRMGVISCKDTGNFDILHIGELRKQAETYGINAKPILVCAEAMDEKDVTMCGYLNVGLVTAINQNLASRIVRILTEE